MTAYVRKHMTVSKLLYTWPNDPIFHKAVGFNLPSLWVNPTLSNRILLICSYYNFSVFKFKKHDIFHTRDTH